jgi:hypothetical protein
MVLHSGKYLQLFSLSAGLLEIGRECPISIDTLEAPFARKFAQLATV